MRGLILATALLALAGCHKKEAGGTVSSSETRALNDAADMLDQDSVDANAVANVAEEDNAQ